MKLRLDPDDLLPEFQKKSPYQVQFDMLSENAKDAVRSVGRATFRSWDKMLYKVIYAPPGRA